MATISIATFDAWLGFADGISSKMEEHIFFNCQILKVQFLLRSSLLPICQTWDVNLWVWPSRSIQVPRFFVCHGPIARKFVMTPFFLYGSHITCFSIAKGWLILPSE